MSQDKIEFYDCSEDAEILTWDSENDAIEAYLDEVLYNLPVDQWPEKVTLYGFARVEPKWDRWPERVLEHLLEGLDEYYGNPETAPTDSMKKLATEFIEKFKAEYQVWSCKRVTSEEINVMDWVKEHCPDWLKEPT